MAALDGLPDEQAAALLDGLLLGLRPEPDEQVRSAMELADRVRHDRGVRRVDDLARDAGLSTRSLQRLFTEYVGVSPKWVILRYRVHEAIERAGGAVDWAVLAAELGYSDQAHLVREVTAAIGMSPAAYAAAISR
ncbi:helix-turn-helix domain-containing protein [Catellatospora bangladeshensis]|uniref:helix-turn-helix domain-containing protein n=1 Tax=Catellatospora bangladeshensis TaxID=310355 RepID=UPI00360B7034